MKKISIKKVIEFRQKSTEKSKATLIRKLKKEKPPEQTDSGGDYWINSLSTISSAYGTNNNDTIFDKIDDLKNRRANSPDKRTRDKYSRNIDILHNFEEIDFSSFKPNQQIENLKKPKDKSIFMVRGVPIQVLPHHVFSFKENSVDSVGAICFVSQLGGFSEGDLAMFTDALFRYLNEHYSQVFTINPEYCSTVDVTTLNKVTYAQIASKTVKSELISTLESIRKML